MAEYYHRGGRFMGRGRGGYRGRGRGCGPFTRPMSEAAASQDPDNTFEIQRSHKYCGAAPLLEQPQVLGGYSIDEDRTFGHDCTMLKFLDRKYLPENGKMKVSLDLNKGIDKACRYIGNSEESFHNLLKWILNNKDCLMNKTEPQRLDVDFISLRRPLTTIMRSPYNFNESWVIYAVEFMGSIYFLKEKGDNFLVHQNQATFRNCFEVWGHKFEDYMCGGDPEGGIQANEEYRCVLKVMMDQTTMVFAPEVDCADPYLYEEGFKDLSGFVMVKCCRELTEDYKIKTHKRHKLCQWWAENKLSGIPRILTGYRNDDGIVHTLELYETDDLPEMAEGEWEAAVCLNFCAKFLDFVKSKIKADPSAVYKFEREKKGPVVDR